MSQVQMAPRSVEVGRADVRQRPKLGWLWFTIVGLAASMAYPFLPRAGVLQTLIGSGTSIAGLVAVLVGIRRHRPARRTGWYLLAVGQASWVIADIIWYPVRNLGHVALPFPNVADAFFLLSYPVFAAGLVALVRTRSGRDRSNFIDSLVITTGVGLISWVFLMSPSAHAPGLNLSQRLVSLAYPILDIALLACLIRFVLTAARGTRSIWLLVAFAGSTLAADTAFLIVSMQGGYAVGGFNDALWMLGYITLGAAALHPSMSHVGAGVRATRVRPNRVRMVSLAVATLTAPASCVIQTLLRRPEDSFVTATATSLMFLLVVVRMQGLVRDLQRSQAERAKVLERGMKAGEEERIRIAMELHDGPIQRLAGVGLRLAAASRRLERGSVEEAGSLLTAVQQQLPTEIGSLRRMMIELRPPSLDQHGIAGALRDQAASFEREFGVECAVDVQVENVPSELETVIFRIAQEALRNIGKHARCTSASISLSAEGGSVELAVADDGAGFDTGVLPVLVHRDHFGLVSMREAVEMAGGVFEVVSSSGGTLVRARFDIGGGSWSH